MSDPNEQIAVTMTRARWSAMLDHLNAEPKTVNGLNITAALACALVRAGMARAEAEVVTYKLGLTTPADIDLIENLREDACELLAERGWWADEPRLDYSRRYHDLKERIVKSDELLDKLKGPQTP